MAETPMHCVSFLIVPQLHVVLPFSFLVDQDVPLILNHAYKCPKYLSQERRQSVRRGYISPLVRHKASSRRLLLRHILRLLKLGINTLVILQTLIILILLLSLIISALGRNSHMLRMFNPKRLMLHIHAKVSPCDLQYHSHDIRSIVTCLQGSLRNMLDLLQNEVTNTEVTTPRIWLHPAHQILGMR